MTGTTPEQPVVDAQNGAPEPYEIRMSELRWGFYSLLRYEFARAICENRTWIGAWEHANEVEREHWLSDVDAVLEILHKRREVMIATVDLQYTGGAGTASQTFLRRALALLFNDGASSRPPMNPDAVPGTNHSGGPS